MKEFSINVTSGVTKLQQKSIGKVPSIEYIQEKLLSEIDARKLLHRRVV
jgi:hypothetical protein